MPSSAEPKAKSYYQLERERIAAFTERWSEKLSGMSPALELVACTRTPRGLKELEERLRWWSKNYPNHLHLDDLRECYRERRDEILNS